MSYQVCYVDASLALADAPGVDAAERSEEFSSEAAALARARELYEDSNCHRIEVCESSGETLRGVRLQLKLGLNVE